MLILKYENVDNDNDDGDDDDGDDDNHGDDDAVNDTKNLWKEASIRVPSLNHRTAGGGSPASSKTYFDFHLYLYLFVFVHASILFYETPNAG